MLYFSTLWLLLSQFNIRFNGKYSLPQATPSSHMLFLLQLLVTNLYKHNPNDVWKNHKIGKSLKKNICIELLHDEVGLYRLKKDVSLSTSTIFVFVFTRL